MKLFRKTVMLLFILTVTLGICGCANKEERWQEQYDLGQQYLNDGNYEEAIISYSNAIKIDEKQAPAYVGRGDAYTGLYAEITENEYIPEKEEFKDYTTDKNKCLQLAADDYSAAVARQQTAETLNESETATATGMSEISSLYDKAIEALLRAGDFENAESFFKEAAAVTADDELNDKYKLLNGVNQLLLDLPAICSYKDAEIIKDKVPLSDYKAIKFLQEYYDEKYVIANGEQALVLYPKGLVYYGGYINDERSGEGISFYYSSGKGKFNYQIGSYIRDIPEGDFLSQWYYKELGRYNITATTIKGNVIKGLWDGTVIYSQTKKDGTVDNFNVIYHEGMPEYTEEEYNGEIVYVGGRSDDGLMFIRHERPTGDEGIEY